MTLAPLFLSGSGGTRLAVRVAGHADRPPIVFVHGWARRAAEWSAQLTDPELVGRFRLLALDLRGHGESEVAETGYDDPEVWAGDLEAVLDFAGSPAVLVGSSYGGLVITDYLRRRGSAKVAGVVLAGALTEIGAGNPGGAVGPLMSADLRAYLSDDPNVAAPALTRLAIGLTAEPDPGEVVQRRLGELLSVPPRVRKAMFKRSTGSAEVLAGLRIPVLIAHGTADRVVDPSVVEYAAGKIPGASVRWFQEVGHLPFAERVAEFDGMLRDFADRCGRTPE